MSFARLLVFVGIMCFIICGHAEVSSANAFAQDSLPVKILIVNSFDASTIKARKDKQELFGQLADSLKQLLYQKTDPPFKTELEMYPDLIKDGGNLDSVIGSLLKSKAAAMAIVIKQLDVNFNKTDVETTGNNKEGKSTEVAYDICSDVTYVLYAGGKADTSLRTNACEPFTKRASFSGFITFGPDIVGKRKYAFRIIAKNATDFLSSSSLFDFFGKHNQ